MNTLQTRWTKILSALVLILGLCTFPRSEANAEDMSESLQSVIEISVDVILVRPLSAVSFVAGTLLYLPAYALSYADGQSSLDEAKEIFFTIPYENAFEREIGDF